MKQLHVTVTCNIYTSWVGFSPASGTQGRMSSVSRLGLQPLNSPNQKNMEKPTTPKAKITPHKPSTILPPDITQLYFNQRHQIKVLRHIGGVQSVATYTLTDEQFYPP